MSDHRRGNRGSPATRSRVAGGARGIRPCNSGGRIMTALDPRQVARAFGAILRAARVAAGLSQEVLAERADCDRTYPSLLERLLRQPTIGTYARVPRRISQR